MRRRTQKTTPLQRIGAFLLALVLVLGIVPARPVLAAGSNTDLVGQYTTVADPDTVSRPVDIYGDNTMNAGKVTVGKSVSDKAVTLQYGSTNKTFTPGKGNFIVTSSQTAQVLSEVTENPVPLDVVFVLDTSGSMNQNGVNRASGMVTAANAAINTLMSANENNRVAVVAFSSSGNYGGGTSDGAAANVLSSLAHYTGDAATNHLRWFNAWGNADNSGDYIAGRDTVRVNSGWGDYDTTARRNGSNGGTNIQAGIIAGAKLLTDVTSTTVTVDGQQVTRMPFLVILSDGQPTFSLNDSNWYNPSNTNGQNGDGNNAFAGNGFLPALTAAYYKAKITEKYYGANASEDNRCSIFTIGVQLNEELAQITMDPKEYFKSGANDYYDTFNNYWTSYNSATAQNFNVRVNDEDTQHFSVTAASINATRNAVLGKHTSGATMYAGGLAYNDEFFPATSTEEIADAFEKAVIAITKKALSSPTHVEQEHGADFSGYVTYTDPLGEYMEVKNIHGVMVNGKLYEGKTFAYHLQNWSSAPSSFKTELATVLLERCKVTGSTMDVDDFITKVVASENQAYYKSETNYDNSLVWWGRSYDVEGEIDDQVQWLGFADNDTVEYINTATKPAGATHICRSYYFYGTAGDVNTTTAEDFLHFVVRVQRELEEPYRETVVISAPASLLSAEKVFVTEKKDNEGNLTYEAEVEEAEPARVVYEVGLRSDINAYNVAQIVGEDTAYIDEKADGVLTNYSVGTDGKENYIFYTNDWDRQAPSGEHHRAMTHVTFNAAADNSFYTFTDDTLIYTKNGDSYTVYNGSGTPSGDGYYYARDVYDWEGKTPTGNVYTGVEKRTEYIPVKIPANASVFRNTDNSDSITNGWYIQKGVYKSSGLTGGEDVYKEDENDQRVNPTGTAVIVSHPHRTDTESNPHYTVLLGNNGKLTLTAEKTKHVSIEKPATTDLDGDTVAAQTLEHADGKPVMVGDTLTYTIDVINPATTAATAKVTDTIPAGTVYVPGSASNGGQLSTDGKQLVWTGVTVPAATSAGYGKVQLTFKVTVTEEALKQVNVENAAYVDFSNDYSYETNTVKNPPEGKIVTNTSGEAITDGVTVPQVLEYQIYWVNDSGATATVTITDKLPAGTTFVSASDGGECKDGVIKWELKDVLAGKDGVVSFRANVNPNAVEKINNKAEIKIGENNPRVTNEPSVDVKLDDLIITKTVTGTTNTNALDQTFELNITEIMTRLSGDKTLERYNGVVDGTPDATETVTFVNGSAQRKADGGKVTIKHGQSIVIKDIPVGSIFSVTEVAKPGFTPSYAFVNTTGQDATSDSEGRVAIKENNTADVNNSAKVDIKNAYSVAPVKFTLQVTKQLDTDFTLNATEFGFVAQACYADGTPVTGANANMGTGKVEVSSNKKTATFTFPESAFNAVGEYYALISETNGGVTGVTYTERQYLLKVKVEDNGTGQLETKVSYQTRDKQSGAWTSWSASSDYAVDSTTGNSNILFTNAYAPLEVDFVLEGNKVLDGRTLQEGIYSFEVKEKTGEKKTVSTGTNKDLDGDGKFDEIEFKPITYKPEQIAAGTQHTDFTYMVSEVKGSLEGVEYSTAVYDIVVRVSHGSDGRLTAKVYSVDGVVVPANGQYDLSFTNTFTPTDATLELEGTKVLTNNTGDASFNLKDQQFAFVVKDTGGNVVATGNNGIGVLQTGTTNVFEAPIKFTPIVFTKAMLGDDNTENFTYEISELIPDELTKDPNMHYDEHNKVTVQVTVTYDPGTGEITVGTPTYSGAIRFENIRQPGSVDVPIVGKKITTGNFDTTNPPSFSFSVLNEGGTQTVVGGSAVANVSGASIQFTNLTYTTEGTYYYWIQETNHAGNAERVHGILYSGNRYLMKVVVERNDDKSWAAPVVTYYKAGTVHDAKSVGTYETSTNLIASPADDVVFTNDYAATGSMPLDATKVLDGRAMKDGDFLFVLERLDDSGNVLSTLYASNPDAALDPSTDKSTATIRFPSIIFDSGDLSDADNNTETPRTLTYKYRMREVVTDDNRLPGVDYSDSVFHMLVTGTETKVGSETKIIGSVTYTNNSFEAETNQANRVFQNSYAPLEGDSIEVIAHKQLTGRALQEGEFSFELYHVVSDTEKHLVDTAANMADTDKDGIADIKFVRTYPAYTTPGTYNYEIVERNNGLGGVDYAKNTLKFTVTIVDRGHGKLEATASTNDAGTFINTYEPDDTRFVPVGNKKLNDRILKAGEFSFEVKEVTGEKKTVSTGMNNGDGTISFTPIGYSKPGTYTYTVSEVQGNLPGVQYDKNVYDLIVTVVDKQDGTMEATGVYKLNGETKEAANFTNTYHPESVEFKLEGTKTLTGRDMVEDEFSFTVERDGKIVATGGNAAAKSGDEAAIDFTDIGLSLADLNGVSEVNNKKTKVITYKIEEQTPAQGGVNIKDGSTSTYYAQVTLEYDTDSGELTASAPAYYSDAACTTTVAKPVFENTYTTAPVTLTLPVDKTLVGKNIAADEFTFTVKQAKLDAEGNVIFDAEGNLETAETAKDKTGKEMVAKNDANGVVTFGDLEFAAPGTYIYQVEEAVTSTDENVRKCYTTDVPVVVVVTVEDDLVGHLIVNAKYHMNYKGDGTDVNLGGVEFVNYYTAPGIEEGLTQRIGATKTLMGRELREGEFKFNVYDIYNNVVSTGTNKDLDGDHIYDEIAFDAFKFENSGEYHYWIVEDDTNVAPGVTVDPRVWEVFITVRYDEQEGKLYVGANDVTTFMVGRAVAEETNKPAFVNVYQPAPKSQLFTAKKELIGRDLRDQEFTFRMMDGEQIAAEARNDASGNINFHIEYTKVGTYNYTITEVNGSDPYIKYNVNDASFGVTVKVTDDDLDGKFEIAVSYADSNRTFVNKYTPDTITVPIYANKTVTGDKEFTGEQFDFRLEEQKPVKGGVVLTQKNDADGLVTFNVTVSAAGQYTYRLTEPEGTDKRYTHNKETFYDVIVDVTDDGHGKLSATVTYPGEGNEPPVFVNTYKAEPYTLTLEGTKELTGRKLKEGEFNFVVHDGQKQVATATNDANGKLVFSNKIDLPEVGNYTLTVSEIKGTDTTVTYDETKFTITATVTNNNGVLEADVKYPEGGVAFVNKYEEPEKPTETTKPAETTKPTEPKAPGAPDTGDHANVLLFGVLAVLSLGAAMAAVILLKRKKHN